MLLFCTASLRLTLSSNIAIISSFGFYTTVFRRSFEQMFTIEYGGLDQLRMH
jgi:hypothetical protein